MSFFRACKEEVVACPYFWSYLVLSKKDKPFALYPSFLKVSPMLLLILRYICRVKAYKCIENVIPFHNLKTVFEIQLSTVQNPGMWQLAQTCKKSVPNFGRFECRKTWKTWKKSRTFYFWQLETAFWKLILTGRYLRQLSQTSEHYLPQTQNGTLRWL